MYLDWVPEDGVKVTETRRSKNYHVREETVYVVHGGW